MANQPPPLQQGMVDSSTGRASRPWALWFQALATFIATAINYQTIEGAGIAAPQEPALNFLSPFTVTDNISNKSTDIGITFPTSGVTATPSADLGPGGTATRTIAGGPYQNTLPNPILIEGYLITTAGGADGNCAIARGVTSGLGTLPFKQQATATDAGGNLAFSCMIPAGWFYQLTAVGTAMFNLGEWYETELS